MSDSAVPKKGLLRKIKSVVVYGLAAWGAFCLALIGLAIAGAHHLAHSIF